MLTKFCRQPRQSVRPAALVAFFAVAVPPRLGTRPSVVRVEPRPDTGPLPLVKFCLVTLGTSDGRASTRAVQDALLLRPFTTPLAGARRLQVAGQSARRAGRLRQDASRASCPLAVPPAPIRNKQLTSLLLRHAFFCAFALEPKAGLAVLAVLIHRALRPKERIE